MTWQRGAIGDLAMKVTKGATPTTLGYKFVESGIPFVRVQNLVDGKVDMSREPLFIDSETHSALRRSQIQDGDLLISIAGTIGRSAIVDVASSLNCNQAVAIVRFNGSVDRGYVVHWLATSDALRQMNAKGVTGTITNLSLAQIKSLQLPLPPLAEQKRIAAILDAADALRAKRRESLVQLDALLQSTFLDMFGDPVTNPMGWDVGRLADVVERLDGGKNVAQSETETEYRVLKVSAVTSGQYRPEESKYLPADFEVPESYLVRKGDLLISRANTAELIGATAYVWDTPQRIVLPDKIWKIVWKEEAEVEPLFVYQISHTAAFRRALSSRASGTSGSMKNIAKPKLLGLRIPLPPQGLQRRFAAIVESVERQKMSQRAHLAELDALFASLQQRAFRGEL
ncbi:MAG: restriction endonuclease subunit S [Acidobacteriota bacterium]